MTEVSRDQERWLPVVGYEGHYEVSDRGRVRSLDRVVMRSNGIPQRQHGRLKKAQLDHKGYLVVDLAREGQKKHGYVHQLVLLAFIGPRPDGMHACHCDGNKLDNRPDNLRWDTLLENNRDILRHGNHNRVNTVACPRGHLLVAPNLVPSHRGRTCLACSRAKSYCNYHVKKKGSLVDFPELADKYYSNIMSAA